MGREMEVWERAVRSRDSLDHRGVDTDLDDHRSEWCVSGDRLSDDDMSPRSGHPVRADAELDAMDVHRTIVAALNIIFARPHQLDRRSLQSLGDHRRLAVNVRICRGAPPKASACHLGM